MEAKDLMIGDWVEFPHGIDRIVDLPYIEGRGLCASFSASATLFPVQIEQLKPIPLTPEILEKNGFRVYEQDFTGNTVYEFGCFDYIEFDRFYKYFNIGSKITYRHFGREITYIHSLMRIYFVHQLQHTLRLCGIDKEIELW